MKQKIVHVLAWLKAKCRRPAPLTMLVLPTPPGNPKPELFGYDMDRIHPFMSQAEVARCASAIVKVLQDDFDRERDGRRKPARWLNEAAGSLWDSAMDYTAYSRDSRTAMRRFREALAPAKTRRTTIGEAIRGSIAAERGLAG